MIKEINDDISPPNPKIMIPSSEEVRNQIQRTLDDTEEIVNSLNNSNSLPDHFFSQHDIGWNVDGCNIVIECARSYFSSNCTPPFTLNSNCNKLSSFLSNPDSAKKIRVEGYLLKITQQMVIRFFIRV